MAFRPVWCVTTQATPRVRLISETMTDGWQGMLGRDEVKPPTPTDSSDQSPQSKTFSRPSPDLPKADKKAEQDVTCSRPDLAAQSLWGGGSQLQSWPHQPLAREWQFPAREPSIKAGTVLMVMRIYESAVWMLLNAAK